MCPVWSKLRIYKKETMESRLFNNIKQLTSVLAGAVVIYALFIISRNNYLLFHTVVETFSVIVAFGIFIVAWNSRRFLENDFLLFLGISYFFVGSIDMFHTFAYKGMIIFSDGGTNLAAQLWVFARYLQGISLLTALLLPIRRIGAGKIFTAYSAVFLLGIFSIFYFKIFPETFIEGTGLTAFKIISEYLISFIFAVSFILLFKRKKRFEENIFWLIAGSIVITIASELAFTLYTDAYGFLNMVGHLLKILAFYLVYKAIIETGFSRPYHLLFRDLKQSRERYESLVEYSPEPIGVYADGVFVYMNPAGLALFGAKKMNEIVGKKALGFIHPDYRESIRTYVQKLRRGEKAEPLREFQVLRLNGQARNVEAISSEIIYDGKPSTQIVIRDITDRKIKEDDLRRTNEFNQTLLNTIPFAIDIVDKEGNILFASKKMEKMFGSSIIGKKCWEVYKDDKKQCENCPLKKEVNVGETSSIEVQGAFGKKIFRVVHTGMIFQNKKAIMEIFRDITEQKSVEKVIQDARIYAESIVNTVRDPLVVLDENLKIVSANWAFYYTFRFLREKTEGVVFDEIYNNYWRISALKEKLEKVVKNNIPIHNLEISHDFPEIGQRTLVFNARRIYQVSGQDSRFLVSIRDITDNKIAEEKIRQSEEKHRNIFDNASDAIVTIDLEDNIVSWNSSAERIFGWTSGEIVGKKFEKLIVPDKFKNEREDILRDVYSGKRLVGIETIRVKKDGSKINVSMTVSPIFNAKREIAGLSGIIRDITKQKQDENILKAHAVKLEKLANDLQKFQLAVANATDLIVIADLEGKILYANEAAENITGFSKKELIGKEFEFLWGSIINFNPHEKLWKTVKDEKKIFVGNLVNKRKNGEKYYAEIKVSPVLDKDKNVIFFAGIERDITREKEIDKAKTEFVSIASHELRTPLANMSLSVEMILDSIAGPLNPEQRKYLRGIYRDIKGMAGLVDALLNVSRIELRTMVVAPEPASLREITENVLKEIAPQINKKDLKIKKVFDSNLPIINVDRNLMRIILQNLLSNAIKYTPAAGKISIEIKKNKNSALIKVSDSGCGVPKDQQSKIFNKLFRARNAIDQGIEGVGLGLYIVKSIVIQCGGRIWIESEENKGTTFFVEIPLEGMANRG